MHSVHPVLHELARAATPRGPRHLHPARPGRRVRRGRALVRLGSAVVRLGLRLRAAGAEQVLGVRPRSGAPPGTRPVA